MIQCPRCKYNRQTVVKKVPIIMDAHTNCLVGEEYAKNVGSRAVRMFLRMVKFCSNPLCEYVFEFKRI